MSYARAIATAKRLIADKGELVTWKEKDTVETTDPDEPWIVTPGEEGETHNVRIVFLPVNRQFAEMIRLLKGSELVGGQLGGLMAQVAFEPQVSGLVTRTDGSKWNVVAVDPLSPGGDIVLYTLEFSK